MDWFLYDNGLRHERVNQIISCDLLCFQRVQKKTSETKLVDQITTLLKNVMHKKTK